MIAAAEITRDPARLAALCSLWQNAGEEVWVTLRGRSMTPAIPDGSRVLIRFGEMEPAIGETLAYRRGGRLIIHRLVSESVDPKGGGRQLHCRGDGNNSPDAPIDPSAVVGVVIAVRRPSAWRRVRRTILELASMTIRSLGRPFRGAAPTADQ